MAGIGEVVEANRLRAEASQFYWYHCIDLGHGVVTDGDYDIAAILPHYRFPDRMDGMSVLDVGRGSGFFSFEFERRGAAVVATEIGSYLDWDFVGGDAERERRRASIGDPTAFTRKYISGAFEFARKTLASKVEPCTLNVYDLSPEALDGRRFDLVFAGSITSHLRDPILAMERLHSVTRGTCIVAAPSFEVPGLPNEPLMLLAADGDVDRRSWWVMNEAGLVSLLRCAGFASAEIVGRFRLVNRRVSGLVVDHIVAHAKA